MTAVFTFQHVCNWQGVCVECGCVTASWGVQCHKQVSLGVAVTRGVTG